MGEPANAALLVGRVESLLAAVAGPLPLDALHQLYLARYGSPLFLHDSFSSLRALAESCPSLCLEWTYTGTPPNYHSEPRWIRSTLLGAASGAQLWVKKRSKSPADVCRDLLIAAIAHYVLCSEAAATPAATTSPSSPYSQFGMRVSLLARIWEANWGTICPLPLLLGKVDCLDLESFLLQLPEIVLTEDNFSNDTSTLPAEDTGGERREHILFLKYHSRIPLIPDILPDPTVALTNDLRKLDHSKILRPDIVVPGALAEYTTAFTEPRPLALPPPQQQPLHHPSLRDCVRQMLFELVTVSCEWQHYCWSQDEDVVELAEMAAMNAAGASRASSLSPSDDSKSQRKREKQEIKQRRRSTLRSFRRAKRWDGSLPPPCAEEAVSDSASGGGGPGTNVINELLEKVGPDQLTRMRAEYRQAHVGVFVSSVKLEWDKYFEHVFPLGHVMELTGIRKLKNLLAEVPNLILMGDGGFMKVVTVYHAKLLPVGTIYPPEGLDASGTKLHPSQLTRTNSDPRFIATNYLAFDSEDSVVDNHLPGATSPGAASPEADNLYPPIPFPTTGSSTTAGSPSSLRNPGAAGDPFDQQVNDNLQASPSDGCASSATGRPFEWPLLSSLVENTMPVVTAGRSPTPALPFVGVPSGIVLRNKSSFYKRLQAANSRKFHRSPQVELFGSRSSATAPSENAVVPVAPLAATSGNGETLSPSSAASAPSSRRPLSVWEMTPQQVRGLLQRILADLIILVALKQREEYNKKPPTTTTTNSVHTGGRTGNGPAPDTVSNGSFYSDEDDEEDFAGTSSIFLRQRSVRTGAKGSCAAGSANMPLSELKLTEDQQKLVDTFHTIGVSGLRLADLPSRWNSSFVKFSPMSSFLKKAGLNTPYEFQQHLLKMAAEKQIIIALNPANPSIPAAVLLPASLEALDDPGLQRPSHVTLGGWLRRKTVAYLQNHPGCSAGGGDNEQDESGRRNTVGGHTAPPSEFLTPPPATPAAATGSVAIPRRASHVGGASTSPTHQNKSHYHHNHHHQPPKLSR